MQQTNGDPYQEQMTEHVDRNQLINPRQHGFMPKKSCVTNLLEFLEKVTKHTDEGIHTEICSVSGPLQRHLIRFLEKLEGHGFGKDLIRWIRNWCSGRKQRVVLNGKKSTWREVLY
jgi:hypothetical protein